MKISFISPPTPFLEYNGFPPLNLLYLSSYIKENGYINTHLVDLNVTETIPESDVYVISATTPQLPYARKLIKKLEGITVIGGAHATAVPDDCTDFDKVIIGDGEKALIRCLDDIRNNQSNQHSYVGKQITDLDSLPMPDRKSIDITKYHYSIDGKPSTLAMTSRGCPYSCSFCQNSTKTKKVRFHSNRYITNEIADIKSCGYEGIYFMDDMFTLRKNLIEIKCPLKDMNWQCQIRPDEKIRNIKIIGKMGCNRVSIGLESGSQNILDVANKKVNLKNVPEIIKECKKQNIKVHPYIILGLPSESHESIKETIDFLRLIEPDSIGVSIFVPYPGTYIYNNLNEFDIKIEDNDYHHYHFRGGKGGYTCVVSTSKLTSQDILKYRDDIDREFN